MTKFAKKKVSAKTYNLAGGKALKHSPEMELIVSVLTTFLDNKFYEGAEERMERLRHLCSLVKPEFVAKLAVMARRDFHLRSVSHLLVGELSKIHRGDSLVSRALVAIAERPDDLIETVAYIGSPVPKQIKKGVRKALLKFNRYSLAKYKNENKDVKLVDLFNLVHPNPKFATVEQQEAWKDLIEGKLKNEETWEARLSSGEDKKKVWHDLVLGGKLGYMATLRNLKNLDKQADKETIKRACEIIANREEVKRSKQLPFRFYSAYEHVENQDMLLAISKGLDYSLDNVPVFDGKTLIAVDGSGSMTMDKAPIKIASIFAAALFKSNDADLILYDTSVQPVKLLKADSMLTLAEKIQSSAHGGGTETSLVFGHALNSRKKYDRIVILSDNESWVEGFGDEGVNDSYNRYKKQNDCFVYAVDIAGYGTKDISGKKVFHLSGWSEKIFEFMRFIEKSDGLVDIVNKIEI